MSDERRRPPDAERSERRSSCGMRVSRMIFLIQRRDADATWPRRAVRHAKLARDDSNLSLCRLLHHAFDFKSRLFAPAFGSSYALHPSEHLR
jgi:hypothetical protein